MRLLLDTHVILWYLTDDERLPSKVKNEITKIENVCFVSIASFWEISIKHSIGKLKLKANLTSVLDMISNSGFSVLPITSNHIIKSAELKFHHRDPFDRLLIAQAISEELTFISKDQEFAKYEVPLLWS
jgi:PIN domain nuclease of toxin-antitoxin system